ncbi:hypothetical protein C4D60_Mb06t13990 [Musa balbisiana]|uniref:RNA-binding protein Tab2-like N-terminal domain-containing protein n=1 Tax=Musa balbisiana TaxID=52838 RepID=A0A4S8IMV7_MUSBA|nr:hypothetical protein C4D60_Mb06t13990 [Musa balbisiana]
MATLGLNCYSSRIRVAKRQPEPLPASSLHPLSKPSSFPRSLLRPSATHSGTRRPRLQAPSASVSTTSTAADDEEDLQEEADEEEAVDPTAELRFLDPAVDPGSIREWEVDFCSRPILDDRGKKLWELVVCDRTLSLQFTRFFPNNRHQQRHPEGRYRFHQRHAGRALAREDPILQVALFPIFVRLILPSRSPASLSQVTDADDHNQSLQ